MVVIECVTCALPFDGGEARCPQCGAWQPHGWRARLRRIGLALIVPGLLISFAAVTRPNLRPKPPSVAAPEDVGSLPLRAMGGPHHVGDLKLWVWRAWWDNSEVEGSIEELAEQSYLVIDVQVAHDDDHDPASFVLQLADDRGRLSQPVRLASRRAFELPARGELEPGETVLGQLVFDVSPFPRYELVCESGDERLRVALEPSIAVPDVPLPGYEDLPGLPFPEGYVTDEP